MAGNLESCIPCDCNFPIAPVGEQGPPGNPGPPGPRGPRGPSGGTGGFLGLENVDEMQNLDEGDLSDFNEYSTAGYYEAGDGGNARYWYSSTATDTVDGGSVLAPLSGVGRFFLIHEGVINLKQFGAKIDGTYKWVRSIAGFVTPHDDAPQVQAAINYASASGAEIYQPPGFCRIGSPLTISKGWGIVWRGKPFTYVTLGVVPTADSADKFLNSILVRDFDGITLTMRGALQTPPAAPDDPSDYDLSSGYRHTGSLIENIVVSSLFASTTTFPAVMMKRTGRCTMRNVAIYRNPGRALEIQSVDDSSFERCFFYVNGNVTFEKAVRMRRTVAATGTESLYVATNTVHFQSCDWEGNNYGNFDVSPTDTGFAQGLYFDGSGLMKTVHAAANGVNCIDIVNVSGVQLDLAAVNMTADATLPVTCTEILRLDGCSDVRGKFFMQQTGTNPDLTLARYVTLVNVDGCDLYIEMFSNLLATDQFMVNADANCSQINVTGTMRFSSDPYTKKLCNVIPNQVNNAATVQVGELLDADMSDSTNSQLISIRAGRYKIRQILAERASVSMTTAQGGISTDPAMAGTVLVLAAQSFSALSAPNKNLDLTLETAAGDTLTDASLYFKISAAQGLPASKFVQNILGNGIVGSGTTVVVVTTLVHNFNTGDTVQIAGATVAAFNGRFKITVDNPLQFRYTVSTGLAVTTKTASSVTSVATTATFNSVAHGFNQFDVVTIAGATPAAYNGAHTITSAAANSFTYTFAGGTSPATGTITATRASAIHTPLYDNTSITATLVPTCDIRVYGNALQ